MAMQTVLILNGPNLDMLGTREPEIYGRDTLESLEKSVTKYAKKLGMQATCFQSNSEGKLINKIHDAAGKYDGIVYNPGAHTHYSYALRDAIGSIDVPVVEVHLSDIKEREPFRRISVIAPACIAQVKGLGIEGYHRALDILQRSDGVKSTVLGEPAAEAPGMRSMPGVAAAKTSQSEMTRQPGTGDMLQESGAFNATSSNGAAGAPGMRSEGCGASERSMPGAPAASSPIVELPTVAGFKQQLQALDPGLVSIERLTMLRLMCSRLAVGAFMVRDTPNIEWLTVLHDVFDEESAHSLLVGANAALLHTDSRYSNAIRSRLKGVRSPISVSDERVSHMKYVQDALTQGGQSEFQGKLGIEDSITYAEFVKAVETFKAETLVPTHDVVLKLRAVKDAGEMLRMRAAQAITDAAYDHIVGFMRPGMTEREVQLELEDFMLRHGAEDLAFRSIVATGPNGADPHAVPGNTRLQKGQCVVMDFGAKAFGYCSDMTRTVFIGKPDRQLESAYFALRQANEAVQAKLKPGVTGKEAHMLAESILAKSGFGGRMGHGLGHGVGLQVHELPVLNPCNEEPLVEGNVVTVEPGIYMPGHFGMRLEDFGTITQNGFDVFTQSSHEMVII